MRHPVRLIRAVTLAVCVGGAVHAQTPTASPIAVEQVWARATPKGAKTGAAYMALTNKGASADRLVGATTPVADSVQFHKETEDNGISRMRQVSGVDLAPGARVEFKPGDMHMMIEGLKQPLTEGQTFPLTLQFEKAGSIAITIPIEKIGAMQHENMQHENVGTMTHGEDNMMQK